MNNVKKVFLRYIQFRRHPLTEENSLGALLRYLSFNIINRFNYEQTISWVEGLKFFARKGDAGLVANIYYGLYEFEESIFLLHFLKKEDLFLDIGANLGHYSLLLSGVRNCRSIAIEPVPQTYKQLCRNIQLNHLQHLIKPLNIGISNAEDSLFFSTDRNTMDKAVSESYRNSVKVKVTTIDKLIQDDIPAAIKLDIEGYEYFALKGAEKTLDSNILKVLIVELNNSGLKYKIFDEDVYKIVIDKGFEPYAYIPHTRTLKKLNSFNKSKFNTIFIRDLDHVQNQIRKADKIRIKNNRF